MPPLLLKLLPVVALFFVGVGLRRMGVLGSHHADALLRVVVYVGLPALILSSLSRLPLTRELAWLPLAAVLTILATWPIASLLARRERLAATQRGAFIIGPMIMNLAAVYPLALLAWGETGFAMLLLLDAGNALLTFTLCYGIACWYGGRATSLAAVARRIAGFPPFLALAAALALNAAGLALPARLEQGLTTVGAVTLPLVMLALGIHFRWYRPAPRGLATAIALRVVLGPLLGLLWVALFNLEGLMRAVVICATAAPIGFNTLVYATAAELDREYAAGLVSVSLLFALAYLPVLVLLL